ncbi:MAG: thiol:disulfide interchange protein DsbA/DsbL [Betaproteobacteria bacterium]|nr:thiol:disulfide interchange protein DsbA/DsbL [Betaproteobacteria bacterium]
MKRRHFSFSLAALPVVQSLPAHAQKRPEEGTDYLQLDKRVSTEAPQGKIEVVEFFWYSCPHCNAFEPKLEAWIKRAPADVAVRRVPVAFRDDFVPQQRLYYVLEALGKIDELHAKVFQAIHVEKQPLNREDSIAAWLDKHGVPRAKFSELYNSFAVTTKARRATQLQDSFKVQGVPALGIAGRWYTDGSLAGNMDRALQVAEFLIAEARKTRA